MIVYSAAFMDYLKLFALANWGYYLHSSRACLLLNLHEFHSGKKKESEERDLTGGLDLWFKHWL